MAILMILIGFFSGLMMMHGLIIPFGQYYSSGMLWGRQIKGPGNGRYWLMALGGLILMLLLFVLMGLIDDGFDYLSHGMIALLVGFGASFYTWYLEQKKCFAGNHIISAVQDVPFMPEVDRLSAECNYFVLGSDGIAFYDQSNYCFGANRFEDYRIGNTPPGELFFSCYAMAQKFNGVFSFTAQDRPAGNGTTMRCYHFYRKKTK